MDKNLDCIEYESLLQILRVSDVCYACKFGSNCGENEEDVMCDISNCKMIEYVKKLGGKKCL